MGNPNSWMAYFLWISEEKMDDSWAYPNFMKPPCQLNWWDDLSQNIKEQDRSLLKNAI